LFVGVVQPFSQSQSLEADNVVLETGATGAVALNRDIERINAVFIIYVYYKYTYMIVLKKELIKMPIIVQS
jgi:Iap family predicted aminopeptidase